MLTQARLQQVLRYNRRTGVFYWRAPIRAVRGSPAGARNSWGYWQTRIDGKQYKNHRLAWLYVYGCFPNGRLDHKNRNNSDNRISNLRVATPGQNRANSSSNI